MNLFYLFHLYGVQIKESKKRKKHIKQFSGQFIVKINSVIKKNILLKIEFTFCDRQRKKIILRSIRMLRREYEKCYLIIKR